MKDKIVSFLLIVLLALVLAFVKDYRISNSVIIGFLLWPILDWWLKPFVYKKKNKDSKKLEYPEGGYEVPWTEGGIKMGDQNPKEKLIISTKGKERIRITP